MGIELELLLLLTVSVVGQSVFAAFAIETPPWQKLLKWSVLVAATLGLYSIVGHWALSVPILGGAIGTTIHFVWCGKHGIDPIRATPRRRYYALRGWPWIE